MHDPATPHLRASDFRLHPAMESASAHWLRCSAYGRHLLKLQLRRMHPELAVHLLWDQPQYEGLLEAMVDVLELREWPRPRTLAERMRAAVEILGMASSMHEEVAAPARTDPGAMGGS